jgi:hypothetical protein
MSLYPSLYPKLPEPPAPEPDQTAEQYGLQILAFIVREGVACTCTAEQLELALHVAPIAAAVNVTGPKDDRRIDYRTVAADAVADAKRLILGTQRIATLIARETAARAVASLPAAPPVILDDDHDDEQRYPGVPRSPYPISPAPGTYARPPAPILNF